MNRKVLVTSYENPDLDGVASMTAYAEYLKKKGVDAVAGVFGSMHKEAQFVIKEFKIKTPGKGIVLLKGYPNVVIVDISHVGEVSKLFSPKKVIKLIDHRRVNEADKFTNADVQIEMVGACATLIAENFRTENISLSKGTSALLYLAIISNTVSFKASVTTKRDIKIANWLKPKASLPKNFVHKMFLHKSDFKEPLEKVFRHDFKIFKYKGKKISIIQLEIAGVKEFVYKNLKEIERLLTKIKEEHEMDVTCLSCIDIERGYNMFVVIDEKTKKNLKRELGVKFKGQVGKREGIIMRKETDPEIWI